MKIELLPRPIAAFPTNWVVVATAEEFFEAQSRWVDDDERDGWAMDPERHGGVTHFYDRFIIVCVSPEATTLSEMVHEAVHVAQHFFGDAHENCPGDEVYAYCVQFIFEQIHENIERRKLCETKDHTLA